MKSSIDRFWAWYERNYKIQIRITTALFLLQIVHLIWMTTNIVMTKITGFTFFPKSLEPILGIVDYTEIPALISVMIVYINDIRKGKATSKTWLYIILLNSQWLHLFWITDEVVAAYFLGNAPIPFSPILAWVAIFIDYLELPVMYDTIKRSISNRDFTFTEIKNEEVKFD